MKFISWNVNGVRAVERKGELEKLISIHQPDLLTLQEIKAKPEALNFITEKYTEYLIFYHSAEKPGYSGTAFWVSKKFLARENFEENPIFITGMPEFEDSEGRIVRIDLKKKEKNSKKITQKKDSSIYSFLGIYFPNGGKSPEAWDDKLIFYDKFLQYVNQLRDEGKKVFWGGDINGAHTEIDLARPKENQNSIGFRPEERAWLDRVIAQNWVDLWRAQNPTKTEVYSWWHVITRSRDRNIGWRIDAVFCDKTHFSEVKRIEYLTHQMGSDHCPVLLEI